MTQFRSITHRKPLKRRPPADTARRANGARMSASTRTCAVWEDGGVDEVLRGALQPILGDLRREGLNEPIIEYRDWTGDPERPSAMLWGPDGSGSGISVERSAALPERIAAVADKVQEWAIEELWGRAAATNWPDAHITQTAILCWQPRRTRPPCGSVRPTNQPSRASAACRHIWRGSTGH